MAAEIQTPAPGSRTVVETQAEPATHNYRAVQVIWFVTSVVTTLIGIRFVLKVLGASLQSGFVTLIYGLTDAMVAPFRAIFPAASGQSSTLDIASLVAIVVYALVGLGLVSGVKLITAPRGARSIS
ncbi:MAG: YggT family protein [Candidatus Dormiibacterota bacterium]